MSTAPGLLAGILPPAVAVAETFADVTGHALFPVEREVIAAAVPRRAREFTTVRWAAGRCLQQLGHPPAPVLPGPMGAPRWPAGLVGSLTHCAGYRAAALASSRQVSGLGIDAEPHESLPAGVVANIASPAERQHLGLLTADHPGVRWDRLLFCAKEAFYKVWSPARGTWLGFDDAVVTFAVDAGRTDTVPGPGCGRFRIRLAEQDSPRRERRGTAGPAADGFPALTGRWLVGQGLVVTAIAAGPGVLTAATGQASSETGPQAGRPATGRERKAL